MLKLQCATSVSFFETQSHRRSRNAGDDGVWVSVVLVIMVVVVRSIGGVM